jgi:neutral amino acid transport system substrate-binding protein
MEASGDGVLKIGVVLESTGEQKFLNEAQRAAVKLAVQDINDAGGFEGRDVQLLPSQAGEAAAIAAQDFINGGADVVIGPTDSSSAPAAIDLLSEASVAIISPANSAAALSDYPSHGYYFRTFPSTVLEGRALAEQVRRASVQDAVILHGESAYISTVTEVLQDDLAAQGITSKRIPLAEGLAEAVQEADAAAADAVVMVAREQVRTVLDRLESADIEASTMFLGSGATAAYGDAFATGALAGVHGLLAGGPPGSGFQQRLLEVDPELEHLTFAAEAYDAVVLAALAAADAGDDSGSSIAGHLLEVSGNHQQGTAEGAGVQDCGSYSACLELLQAGKTIDYQGESGPVTFNDDGDIRTAKFTVYEYGAQNLPRYSGTVRVSLPGQPGR